MTQTDGIDPRDVQKYIGMVFKGIFNSNKRHKNTNRKENQMFRAECNVANYGCALRYF